MGKNCLVCRNGVPGIYGDRTWNFSGKTYRLALCPVCGSVFTDPLPDDSALKMLYDKGFDYRWYQDHYEAKLQDCRIRINEYRTVLGQRVLDFGGGIGYFSAAAREQGFESRTFDPFYEKKDRIEQGWDTLVALHVLEHSNDPDALIDRIKRLLTPGGKLILAVPNFLSLGYKQLGMDWVWAQPPLLHIFHFTPTGLKMLLSRHGFTDCRISFHERWDANLYTDLKHVNDYRRLDGAWFKRPYNFFPLYRKLIARRNSTKRFKGLEEAMKDYSPSNDIYAELQIIATAR